MKTEVVRLRLTKMEKRMFIDYSTRLNMSLSDYIRFCCLMDAPSKYITDVYVDIVSSEKTLKNEVSRARSANKIGTASSD